MSAAGLLLAAGAGSRFGGGKLIHPIPPLGRPLAVESYLALRSALERVVVVVRAGDAALAAALTEAGAAVTPCADAHEGMGRSLAAGVRATPDADGWIVALGDMPRVQPATIAKIAEALARGASIAVPVHDGRRGHPVGFSARHGDALQDLRGDEGARHILAAHSEEVERVLVDDPGIHADVDTREDAARLK